MSLPRATSPRVATRVAILMFFLPAPSRDACRAFWTIAVAVATSVAVWLARSVGAPNDVAAGLLLVGATGWTAGWIAWRRVAVSHALWMSVTRRVFAAVAVYVSTLLEGVLTSVARLLPPPQSASSANGWRPVADCDPTPLEGGINRRTHWAAVLFVSAESRRDRALSAALLPFLLTLSHLPGGDEETAAVPFNTYTFS